ncbi:hypothetical protein D3C71_2199850 [compost metagenome]
MTMTATMIIAPIVAMMIVVTTVMAIQVVAMPMAIASTNTNTIATEASIASLAGSQKIAAQGLRFFCLV